MKEEIFSSVQPPVAYSYDPLSLACTHAEPCMADPLESALKQEPVWLVPANATLVPPPDKTQGCVPVWQGEAWLLKEDLRDTDYWLPDDDWQSPPRSMKDLGPLPQGALLAAPEKPAPTVQELADEVRAERDRRLAITDYLVMPDYPLEESQRQRVTAYRKALRDVPAQEGFPWSGWPGWSGALDGGGDDGGGGDARCPWPVLPEVLMAR